MIDDEPKKYPREVRKNGYQSSFGVMRDWEETTTPGIVESLIHVLDRRLPGLGIDLQKAKVLEVGSGAGLFLKALHGRGIDATGIDVRPRGHIERTAVARIEQLPFADGSFDLVAGSSVFDHKVYNQNQEVMLSEIARVLRPGGVFLPFGIEETLRTKELSLVENESIVKFYQKK